MVRIARLIELERRGRLSGEYSGWVLACADNSPSPACTETHTQATPVSGSQQTLSHMPSSLAFLVPGEVRAILKQGGSEKGRKGSLRAWGCLQPTRFLGLALSPLGSMESRR